MMTNRMRHQRVAACLTSLFCVATAHAWNSIGPYTHEKLTDDAIAECGANYPDLYNKFPEQLRDGSETEAHNPPGDGNHIDMWAPPYDNWFSAAEDEDGKGAIFFYLDYDFPNAYLCIGYDLHLLQDEYVPPHIRKCPHGNVALGLPTDSFENWVDNATNYDYSFDGDSDWTFYDDENQPWSYWLDDRMDDDDQNNQPDGDGGGGDIVDGPNAFGVGNTNWGTYGYGDYWFGFDRIPGRNQGYDYFGTYPNSDIAHKQLKGAKDDSVIEMTAISLCLPPLVPDDAVHGHPSISAAVFSPSQPVAISFVAMENRKSDVFVTILADTTPIKDTAGKVWNGGANATYPLPSGGAGQLPWHGTITINWSGQLSTGTLAEGEHTIHMQVRDQDGNSSQDRTRTVRYDKTKPTGVVTVTVHQ